MFWLARLWSTTRWPVSLSSYSSGLCYFYPNVTMAPVIWPHAKKTSPNKEVLLADIPSVLYESYLNSKVFDFLFLPWALLYSPSCIIACLPPASLLWHNSYQPKSLRASTCIIRDTKLAAARSNCWLCRVIGKVNTLGEDGNGCSY